MLVKLGIARVILPALIALAGFVAESPGRSSDLSYGMELLRQGRIDQALVVFEAEKKMHPNDPVLLNAIGAALCLKNRAVDALPLFQKALQNNENFMPALKNLAITEFNLGRYDSAVSHFEVLLKSSSGRAEANLFLGMIASARRRDHDAIRYFGEAGELSTREPRAQISFARSLCSVGESDRGGGVLDALQKRADLSARDHLDAVTAFSECGRNDKALEELASAERLDPALPGLAYQRIDLLAKAGRAAEAITLARDLALRSPDGQILTLMAQIAENAGKLDVAIEALRKAIQIEPESEDHYIDLSLLCTKYRNNNLALEILDLGLGRLPHSYRLLVQKGITLEHSDKHEEAQKTFSEAIRLTPDHSVALAALAVSEIMSDKLADALSTLSFGVEKFQNDFYLHYLYGFALERSQADAGADKKTAQMAATQLGVAIALNPRFSSAYYHLGKLLAETNPKAAIHNLEMAVRLDPNAVAAKYQLARLYLKFGNRQAGTKLMNEVNSAKAASLELEQKPSLVVIEGRSTP